MKKLLITLSLLSVYAYGQCCFSGPISTRIGIKTGLNYGIFNRDDGVGELNGLGWHIGLGMGTDILDFLAIDMTPQIRSTYYSLTTDEGYITPVTTSYSFTNLYLPVIFSVKLGVVPLISPYIGIGGAGNFQLSGKVKDGHHGSGVEQGIEELENDFFIIGALGAEIKLIKLKISPEVSLNYNLTADDSRTSDQTEKNYDIHLSIGLYYSL
jgi:hypothetical protein